MNMQEMRSIRLPWDEVSKIISSEMERIVGIQIECKANVAEHEFWDVDFIHQQVPLPKFCQFIQSLQPTSEDWEDALMGEIGAGIKGISMFVGEKIIGQHLHITWKHRVIGTDGLWLVGVTENDAALPTPDGNERKLPDDLAQAITVIADHVYGKEPSYEQE